MHRINDAGYDMDYISDNFIRTAACRDKRIVTSGGATYKALVVPGARLMPADVLAKLLDLAKEGRLLYFWINIRKMFRDMPDWNGAARNLNVLWSR